MAEIGQQLVTQYYQQFDNKATRGNLAQIFVYTYFYTSF